MLIRTCLIAFFLIGNFHPLTANDWPGWRGPGGDGKLESDLKYPQQWSAQENVIWRTQLPAPGNSSPVVVGNKIFLSLSENQGQDRSLLCFDASDGSMLWKKTASTTAGQITHKTNPYCAASPFCDGEQVYVWFGNAGLYAYDLNGKEIWSTTKLGDNYQHQWGPNAASPVVHQDLLLIHAGPGTSVGLFGIDRRTGKIKWQNKLQGTASENVKSFKGSWATPLVTETGSSFQILLGLPGSVRSFDPDNGREIWRCGGLGDLAYTNVLTGGGRAVYLGGYGSPGIGLRLPEADESGDITDTYQLWADPPKSKKRKNPQRIGSGQIVGDFLYLLNEPGQIECIEVETGKSRWKERLSGKSWSSMNYINGLLYVNDMKATSYLIKPDSKKLDLVAQNKLDPKQHTNASMAFAGGRIFFRSDQYLYAIGKK